MLHKRSRVICSFTLSQLEDFNSHKKKTKRESRRVKIVHVPPHPGPHLRSADAVPFSCAAPPCWRITASWPPTATRS
jgi:hypothetical protein